MDSDIPQWKSWRGDNREVFRERNRGYRSKSYWADPEKARERQRAYSARYRASEANQARKGLGDVDRIKEKLRVLHGDRCAYCRELGVELDHIRCVTRGGTHEMSNLQLVCVTHNRQKANLDPEEFARRLGLLI